MQSAEHHPSDILRFASASMQSGARIALVVVTAVTGGAMRARGALMCVTPQSHAGYVSNGCVDADIIFQAREVISSGVPRALVYGEGSAFKDIHLPCGGRIDLWVTSDINAAYVAHISASLDARTAVNLNLGDYNMRYTPPLRLRIIGRGQAVRALAQQAISAGFPVILQSPEREAAQGLNLVRFEHLTDPKRAPEITDDPWSAVVVMFHDHDWEPQILAQACRGPAFYIGAMGSPRTHALRCEALKDIGVSAQNAARIHGPIGLIPSMRDANLLALSTLAQIVEQAGQGGWL